jgi:hypothetical protein
VLCCCRAAVVKQDAAAAAAGAGTTPTAAENTLAQLLGLLQRVLQPTATAQAGASSSHQCASPTAAASCTGHAHCPACAALEPVRVMQRSICQLAAPNAAGPAAGQAYKQPAVVQQQQQCGVPALSVVPTLQFAALQQPSALRPHCCSTLSVWR